MARGKHNPTKRTHMLCHCLNRMVARQDMEMAQFVAREIVKRNIQTRSQLRSALTPAAWKFIVLLEKQPIEEKEIGNVRYVP